MSKFCAVGSFVVEVTLFDSTSEEQAEAVIKNKIVRLLSGGMNVDDVRLFGCWKDEKKIMKE